MLSPTNDEPVIDCTKVPFQLAYESFHRRAEYQSIDEEESSDEELDRLGQKRCKPRKTV